MDSSSALARTLSGLIGPIASPIEFESLKRSPSESASGPVESVESILKVQVADLFEVCLGPMRTQMDPNGSVAGPKRTEIRPENNPVWNRA